MQGHAVTKFSCGSISTIDFSNGLSLLKKSGCCGDDETARVRNDFEKPTLKSPFRPSDFVG